MKVYLDNAATTPLDPEVFEAMRPFMMEQFGNPSSTHAHGRAVRAEIEKARKTVAELLNTTPGEIFFTSGGTEADNTIITSNINSYSINHVITSEIEHPAVLQSVKALYDNGKITVSYVNLDGAGRVDYDHLEQLLSTNEKSLVSLMHGNNEIGNITDIEKVGEICHEHHAIFHSDTVQTIGHFTHDLSRLKIDAIAGSGHKFHGPKGIGFMYVSKACKFHPLIHGGGQERKMRGGTENVYGIIGLAKALEIAYRDMYEHQKHIQGLKDRMIANLKEKIGDIHFNGDSANHDKSLYTVLNASLPVSEKNDMMLFNLDINGISASGGSACSSGATKGSHVLEALERDPNRGAVRFSFSKYNTAEEIDYTAEKLAEYYKIEG
ncbi:MAG: cysteine desulfurase [Cyclobacteriaceae bacterium]|nr:cysteine desulfurase [Cyclobacteriaceae bacterium]